MLMLAFQAQAQYRFPDKALAQEVKGRTLAVQLLEETSDTEKNLNAAMKEAFTENWIFSQVEFFSPAEIQAKRKAGDQKYALLVHSDMLKRYEKTYNIGQDGRRSRIGVVPGPGQTQVTYTTFTFTYYNFDLIIPGGKEKTVTSIGFANGDLYKIDFLFLTQQLSRLLDNAVKGTLQSEYYNVERNIETVKKYKLYLLKDFFTEKDIANMSKYYEYDYELVDYDRYEDVILNKEANAGYVKIIWSNQHQSYVWLVVDSSDGGVLSLLNFGGVSFGKHHNADDIIQARHLKYITYKGGQKMNNKYK